MIPERIILVSRGITVYIYIYIYIYIYSIVIGISTMISNDWYHECANCGRKVTRTNKVFVVVPTICGLQLEILLHLTILQIRNVRWLLDFEKFVNP